MGQTQRDLESYGVGRPVTPELMPGGSPLVGGTRQDAKRESIRHILSVDVEDYFQVEAFAHSIPRSSWDQWPSRVVANTHRVLDLFDEFGASATFFFVGWVAQRFPALVREAHSRGHEVACHSYWHRPVYSLTPEEFRSSERSKFPTQTPTVISRVNPTVQLS